MMTYRMFMRKHEHEIKERLCSCMTAPAPSNESLDHMLAVQIAQTIGNTPIIKRCIEER